LVKNGPLPVAAATVFVRAIAPQRHVKQDASAATASPERPNAATAM
jgi:hypothetical protein